MTASLEVNRLFHALADPTRLQIVHILSNEGKQPATSICDHFEVSRPAISQHLSVLRDASVVMVEKKSKFRVYSVNRDAILEIENWTSNVRKMLGESFRELEKILEAQKKEKQKGS